jgi:hypothetical protein
MVSWLSRRLSTQPYDIVAHGACLSTKHNTHPDNAILLCTDLGCSIPSTLGGCYRRRYPHEAIPGCELQHYCFDRYVRLSSLCSLVWNDS